MTQDSSSVLYRVSRVVSEVLALDDEELSSEMLIREDLGADSLDLVTLVWALEEEFGGRIDEVEVEQLTTPGKIAVYIENRMNVVATNEP